MVLIMEDVKCLFLLSWHMHRWCKVILSKTWHVSTNQGSDTSNSCNHFSLSCHALTENKTVQVTYDFFLLCRKAWMHFMEDRIYFNSAFIECLLSSGMVKFKEVWSPFNILSALNT